ncbi:MAG TPA: GNAT family N-acetyltransferase [Ktedonobacterales bacterium]|nr:GNAT family N-acetyltransferase [Ktedonobacterales bacterium]
MPGRLWAYERGTLWALELADAPVAVAPRVLADFGEARPADASALAAALGPDGEGELRRRRAAGSRCFVARVAGTLAAWGWVSFGVEAIGELERSLHMRPGEAYCWDCVTLPAYRGRGLYTALLGHLAATLRGAGAMRLWIGASRANRPSVRGFAAAGFRPAVNLTYLRLGGWRHVWIGAAPHADPALAADARRALAAPGAGDPGLRVPARGGGEEAWR